MRLRRRMRRFSEAAVAVLAGVLAWAKGQRRVSCYEDDPGYGLYKLLGLKPGEWKVYVDGIDVTEDCFMADPNAGMAGVRLRGVDGQLVIDREKDELVSETLYGRVRVLRNGVEI